MPGRQTRFMLVIPGYPGRHRGASRIFLVGPILKPSLECVETEGKEGTYSGGPECQF